MKRWSIGVSRIRVMFDVKVDMVLDEAGIDGDGKFRYNDFVDRLNSDN